MRRLIARLIAWALPMEFWCPCLKCTLTRQACSEYYARRVEINKRERDEPWLRTEVRPTEPHGRMYQRSKEH